MTDTLGEVFRRISTRLDRYEAALKHYADTPDGEIARTALIEPELSESERYVREHHPNTLLDELVGGLMFEVVEAQAQVQALKLQLEERRVCPCQRELNK